jgi:hypothetical protein
MSKKSSTPFPVHDDVDRALLQAKKAVCTLVTIAASNPGPLLASDAMTALRDLGTMAALPVAAVIEQIPWASRRLMLVDLLQEIPPPCNLEVPMYVMRIGASDPSESVRTAATETSAIMRKRSHERFKRLAELEAAQQQGLDELRTAETVWKAEGVELLANPSDPFAGENGADG